MRRKAIAVTDFPQEKVRFKLCIIRDEVFMYYKWAVHDQ